MGVKERIIRFIQLVLIVTALGSLCACSVVGYKAKRIYKREAVYYDVKKGDSIPAIAKKYKVSEDQIVLLNGLVDKKNIHVGQHLLVRQAYEYEVEEDEDETSGPVKKVTSRGPTFYSDGKLKWPVRGGGRLVSRFGPRNGNEFHDGLDIAALSGTPVLAAHDGEVLFSGDQLSGYGNLLIIKGPGNIKTVYAHNRRLLVSVGKRVKKGDVVAEVGSTGKSEGPHLHFEVRTQDREGRYVAIDPLSLFIKSVGKPRYRVNDNLTPILAEKSNKG